MAFLCQLRKNGNVVQSVETDDVRGIIGFFEHVTTYLKTCQEDAPLLQNFSVGVTAIPEGRPVQFQAITIFNLTQQEATSDEPVTLADLKDYLEDAVRIEVDEEEHQNPYGVRPLLLIDTLSPVEEQK